MAEPFLLSEAQTRRIEPFFPLQRGSARVDDRRVLSGIIYVIRNGLMWRDAPPAYGPHKTLHNRFVRWSRAGVFNRIFAGLAAEGGAPDQLMVDATHLKAHRTAASLRKKGRSSPRFHQCAALVERLWRVFRAVSGMTYGGLNSKLHAVCDEQGRPRVLLLTEGQVSDYKGAATMLPAMPAAPVLIADRGYDADWFRQALRDRGTRPCIPGRAGRSRPIRHSKQIYRSRHKIEIMFGRLKNCDASRPGSRPMRPHLHVRHRARGYRHLLAAAVVSPEPRHHG